MLIEKLLHLRAGRYLLLAGLLCAVAVIATKQAPAVSVGGRVLESVRVTDKDAPITTVLIRFVAPMQYQWHFPKHRSSEFLISLRPVNVNLRDSEAYSLREHLRAPLEDSDLIKDIDYDGTADDGPFLTIQFNKNVEIEVSQAEGIRSLQFKIRESKDVECGKTQTTEPSPSGQ
jgi:hypothetical protein